MGRILIGVIIGGVSCVLYPEAANFFAYIASNAPEWWNSLMARLG